MDQTVLVHAQVDKGPKCGHVADGALQHHAHFQVFEVFHALLELGHLEIGSGVAAGFFQLDQNVFDGDDAHGVIGEQLGLEGFEHVGAAHQFGDGFARLGHDALHHWVGFGVYRCHIQRVVTPSDAQKTRALLEGFGAQTTHFEQLLAIGKGPIGFAPTHHRFGRGGAQTRHPGEQRHTGGVEVHANGVDAVLDHAVQAARQFGLVHVVLVLAHANGLGIDLDQFGQRVLHTPGNAGRAAQADIHIGHFGAGVFAGAVNRGTGFTDHHLGHGLGRIVFGHELDEFASQFVGFAAGRAVANGDEVDAVFFTQLGQSIERPIPIFARLMGVNGGGFHQLAGGVDHRHFDAGANARVQAHHHPRPSRCGQQQITQVVGKHLDRHLFRLLAQAGEQVAFDGHAELDAPGPGHTLAQQVVSCPPRMAPAEQPGQFAFGQARLTRIRFKRLQQLGIEDFQAPAPKHRQCAVRGHAVDGFVVFEIVAELGHIGVLLVFARRQLAAQQALVPQPFAHGLHQCGVFRPAFAQQVAHPIEHRCHAGKVGALRRACGSHMGLGLFDRVQTGIGPQSIGQGLETGLTRHLAFGAALEFVGQVQVFERLLGEGHFDGRIQCGGELALLGNGFADHVAPLCQLAQVVQALGQFAQLDVVQTPGDLFAVAGDEGHRGTFIEQCHRRADLLWPGLNVGGQLVQNLFHRPCHARKAAKCATPLGARLQPCKACRSWVPMSGRSANGSGGLSPFRMASTRKRTLPKALGWLYI